MIEGEPQVVYARRCGGCQALVTGAAVKCGRCGARLDGRGRASWLPAFMAGFIVVGAVVGYVMYRRSIFESGMDSCRGSFGVSERCQDVLGDARFHGLVWGAGAGLIGGAFIAFVSRILRR